MKIRTGFVSNSSSSSFVIVGKIMDFNDFVNAFKLDFIDFEFDKVKDWDLQNEFETYMVEELPKLLPGLDLEVMLYGNLGSHDRVVIFSRVPEDPKKSIKVIEDVSKRLGSNVVVRVLEDDSESGVYFQE
jgi:hypothetical protein